MAFSSRWPLRTWIVGVAASIVATMPAVGCGSSDSGDAADDAGAAQGDATPGDCVPTDPACTAPPGDGGAQVLPDGAIPDASRRDAAPVPGIFDVRAHGAKGDGTTDDTAGVRATIAAAAMVGGGIVYFPAGRYRIKGGLSVGAAVTLAGEGFTPPGSGAPGALAGSWIVVDAALLATPAITLAEGGATVRDLGVWHEQAAPGPGWTPRAFGWAVDMAVPDTLTRNVWLANPTLGIHGIGRVTIENVQGQPITTGIQIDTAYDVVRIRRVRFNWTGDGLPVWSADPSVLSHMGVALESFRNDNPEIADVKVASYATGIHFGASAAGVTSKFAMMDTYVSNAGRCVTIDGASTTGKFARMWASGCATTGIWVAGAGSVVSGADLDLREIGDNAIRVEAPSAFFLANQLTVVNWDKESAGFPAVEAAHAGATVKVGLFRSFTGGAVQLGGVGHVTADTNGGDTAFDLRMPTPTSVPESLVTPYAAQYGVLAYGARGDGTGDDTAAIQAAMDDAAKNGGGPVVVPAGDFHLKGSLNVPAGVTLVGVGWQGQGAAGQIDAATGQSPAGKVFKGSYLSIDAASTADAVVLGDHARISMLGFRWDQGAVHAGWQPRAFGWAVRVTGVDVQVRDLFLLNPTKGIAITSAAKGSVLVDHVFGSPQATGLYLDTEATVRANDLHFWPFWGLGGAYGDIVAPHLEGSAVAFQSDHSIGAEISNAFSINYQVGLLLGANGAGKASTDFRLWNADQDVGVRGYVIGGAGTQATFANFSAQGDTSASTPGVTGIWAQPSAVNAQVSGYNGDLRIFTGNAVRSDAPGASVRVNLMRLEGWGRGGGFPPVEGGAVGPDGWLNGS